MTPKAFQKLALTFPEAHAEPARGAMVNRRRFLLPHVLAITVIACHAPAPPPPDGGDSMADDDCSCFTEPCGEPMPPDAAFSDEPPGCPCTLNQYDIC